MRPTKHCTDESCIEQSSCAWGEKRRDDFTVHTQNAQMCVVTYRKNLIGSLSCWTNSGHVRCAVKYASFWTSAMNPTASANCCRPVSRILGSSSTPASSACCKVLRCQSPSNALVRADEDGLGVDARATRTAVGISSGTNVTEGDVDVLRR